MTIRTPVKISISEIHSFNGRIEKYEFSAKRFKSEIETIETSQVFKNAKFSDTEEFNDLIKVKIHFETRWLSDGCYLGSCIVWPMQERASNRIEFKVFDSAGLLIFSNEDEIHGSGRGTALDFSKGFKPLRQIYSKGSAVLIKRSLERFQASEAFKKLTESGK